jgi:uncharacterized protein YdeI (YjbR/CyaY-like superfamily)
VVRTAVRFFRSPAEFRRWLERHHRSRRELIVGFHKRHTGKPSLTWPEAVDEALCFGWIDGVRRRLDDERYAIRFTPRKPESSWSVVNLRRVRALRKAGRMRPAGLRLFLRRDRKKSGLYSFEQRHQIRLPPSLAQRFRAHAGAWAFFQRQAPWYQRTAAFWVVSAKREATRRKRLATLIAYSWRGRPIPPLARTRAQP